MPNLDPRLIGECATWLSITGQLFGTRMGKLLEPYGLTQGQFSILHHITLQKLKGGMRISEISNAVEVGQPAVTKAIAKFENLGLVSLTSSSADRRAKTVIINQSATELVHKVRIGIGPDLGQVFGNLDTAELSALTETLRKLGTWLDDNR